MSTNANLSKAKDNKNDEFYTQYEDIEKELQHYKEHFKDKVIYCNCDNPTKSAFWTYLHLNFNFLELKKIVATYYTPIEEGYKTEYSGGNDEDITYSIKTSLKYDGDFRSDECIEILKEADIIITNPPFSLFREYVALLIEYQKKFLIIGNKNAVTNKDFFPLLQREEVWVGYNNVHAFTELDGSIRKFGNIGWYTNLDIEKRHKAIPLNKSCKTTIYQKYDNFDAIDVPKVADIPYDYDGIMGVPITIMDKLSTEQFEIVWQASGNTRACCPLHILNDILHYQQHKEDRGGCGVINGVRQYSRIFIKRK